jgi:radical SAM protein with 4Fe4S-binding SPASM domain
MKGMSTAENDDVLAELAALEHDYRGRMLVRSKCQPQIMRHVYDSDPESPLLNYATRCPCGVQYCRITPDGKVTPCPYMEVVAGDLSAQSFGEIWRDSPVFGDLRGGELGGKCGRCGYREICGGCRARAYADTGDYLGPDASCGYEPDGVESPVTRTREITYGTPARAELEWSPEAAERVARIPSFVRGVVTHRVEAFAVDHGHDRVTTALLDEVRSQMPIDFSKRRPFFSRERE